jgi:hypothetical protein
VFTGYELIVLTISIAQFYFIFTEETYCTIYMVVMLLGAAMLSSYP